MCDYYDQDGITDAVVSDADKHIIVEEHNKFRAGVSPTASNMMKLVRISNLHTGTFCLH